MYPGTILVSPQEDVLIPKQYNRRVCLIVLIYDYLIKLISIALFMHDYS